MYLQKSNLNIVKVIFCHVIKCLIRLYTLRKKCPYSELFWSVFSYIRVYGHFSRSHNFKLPESIIKIFHNLILKIRAIIHVRCNF